MMLDSILLVFALCIDAFVASIAYGTNKIKIPIASNAAISAICTAILAISILFGTVVKQFIPINITIIICFTILLVLGLMKVVESSLKIYIKRRDNNKNIKFKLFNINFVFNIYDDNIKKDTYKYLTLAEASYLAISLSLDGMAAGFGNGMVEINIMVVVILSIITNILAVLTGSFIGRKIVENSNVNLSWLSGIILIALAIMKLS